MKYSNVEHKIANGVIKKYMQYKGFKGWTSFWNTIYYIDRSSLLNPYLRKHELKHIEQINRLGRLRFFVEYLWQNIKYGYDNNKFEIEAREAEKV
jgi:hypothetical protein